MKLIPAQATQLTGVPIISTTGKAFIKADTQIAIAPSSTINNTHHHVVTTSQGTSNVQFHKIGSSNFYFDEIF